MYKHQSLNTQHSQDLVFIHVHNVIEENIYELPLWQYENENFKSYSGNATHFSRKYLSQNRILLNGVVNVVYLQISI